jgi:hypothetical protein
VAASDLALVMRATPRIIDSVLAPSLSWYLGVPVPYGTNVALVKIQG